MKTPAIDITTMQRNVIFTNHVWLILILDRSVGRRTDCEKESLLLTEFGLVSGDVSDVCGEYRFSFCRTDERYRDVTPKGDFINRLSSKNKLSVKRDRRVDRFRLRLVGLVNVLSAR